MQSLGISTGSIQSDLRMPHFENDPGLYQLDQDNQEDDDDLENYEC